jgi:methionyl-tRNA formyltransferase
VLYLFVQGAFGEFLLGRTEKLGIDAKAYTYAINATRSRTDRNFLRSGLNYINEHSYNPKLINIRGGDTVICASWTKDFFHNSLNCGFKVFHVHPSLLPKYRGPSAVSAQFSAGVCLGGVSIYLDSGTPDAGAVAYQTPVRIDFNDYPMDYLSKCADFAAEGIAKILNGSFTLIPQENRLATYTTRVRGDKILLDFSVNALYFYNTVRAFSFPFGGANLMLNGKLCKVMKCSVESWSGNMGEPGELIDKTEYGEEYACGEGSVILTEVI